jgi:hypothetical protein
MAGEVFFYIIYEQLRICRHGHCFIIKQACFKMQCQFFEESVIALVVSAAAATVESAAVFVLSPLPQDTKNRTAAARNNFFRC